MLRWRSRPSIRRPRGHAVKTTRVHAPVLRGDPEQTRLVASCSRVHTHRDTEKLLATQPEEVTCGLAACVSMSQADLQARASLTDLDVEIHEVFHAARYPYGIELGATRGRLSVASGSDVIRKSLRVGESEGVWSAEEAEGLARAIKECLDALSQRQVWARRRTIYEAVSQQETTQR